MRSPTRTGSTTPDGYPEAAITDAAGGVVETVLQNGLGDVVTVPYSVEVAGSVRLAV